MRPSPTQMPSDLAVALLADVPVPAGLELTHALGDVETIAAVLYSSACQQILERIISCCITTGNWTVMEVLTDMKKAPITLPHIADPTPPEQHAVDAPWSSMIKGVNSTLHADLKTLLLRPSGKTPSKVRGMWGWAGAHGLCRWDCRVWRACAHACLIEGAHCMTGGSQTCVAPYSCDPWTSRLEHRPSCDVQAPWLELKSTPEAWKGKLTSCLSSLSLALSNAAGADGVEAERASRLLFLQVRKEREIGRKGGGQPRAHLKAYRVNPAM